MGTLFQGLGAIAGLAAFVCFIMVVIKMFKNDKTGLGIASIVLFFCCGIGHIIALVVGWQNAEKWDLKTIMLIYTIAFILAIVAGGIGGSMQMSQLQQQLENMPR